MSGSTVILGHGLIGRWIADDVLRHGRDTVRVDVRDGDVRADAVAPDEQVRALVRQAGVVVLALPESVGVTALEWVLADTPADAAIVTTATEQSACFTGPAGPATTDRLVGFTPMFRPDIASSGQAVAIVATETTRRDVVDLVTGWARSVGARPVQVTPDEHDAALRLVQVVPHAAALAVAATLATAGEDVDRLWRLAPPPARTLIAVAARILEGSRAVYSDLQATESAARARQDLRAALDAIESRDAPTLRQDMDRWAGAIGPAVIAEGAQLAREIYARSARTCGTDHPDLSDHRPEEEDA